jgi:TolA-binding protein
MSLTNPARRARRNGWAYLLAAVAALGVLAPSSAKRATSPRKPQPFQAELSQLAAAEDALARGQADVARDLVARLPEGRLPPEKADATAWLRAILTADGAAYDRALSDYLQRFPDGAHRREATLALARLRYVGGDYQAAENLLSIFSPGVERNETGREALVTRGLAQLGRGDANGALQFLQSAEGDLKGTTEEEAYRYAVAEAAIRAGNPTAAMAALRALLEKYPQGDYAPQALYAMGTSLEMVGRQADAANVFRQVAQRFPLSYEATRVRDRGIRPGVGSASLLPIGGGFAIQVGAFTRKDLADALAKELREGAIGDVSVRSGDETPPIFRVRAGSFSTRDEARALGERLRRDRGFSYQVVPR